MLRSSRQEDTSAHNQLMLNGVRKHQSTSEFYADEAMGIQVVISNCYGSMESTRRDRGVSNLSEGKRSVFGLTSATSVRLMNTAAGSNSKGSETIHLRGEVYGD